MSAPGVAAEAAAQLAYLKARQKSILLKIEDLEIAVTDGVQLDSYLPEDLSLDTQQPQDSKFAKAFLEAEKRAKPSSSSSTSSSTAAPEGEAIVAFRGSDLPGEFNHVITKSPSQSTVKSHTSTKSRGGAQLKTDQALLNACYFGNTNQVIKFVRQGADVEYMDERDGWSNIHYAARWGDVKMLMCLLNAGADVNLRTNGKETALHKAARWDQKDVAVLLLKRGALSHFKNSDGMKASQMTQDPELSYLIDNFEDWCEEEIARIQKEEMDRNLEGRKQAMVEAQEQRLRDAEEKQRQERSRQRMATSGIRK